MTCPPAVHDDADARVGQGIGAAPGGERAVRREDLRLELDDDHLRERGRQLLQCHALALQGDVLEHMRVLRRVGATPTRVRRPEQLDGLGVVEIIQATDAYFNLTGFYHFHSTARP